MGYSWVIMQKRIGVLATALLLFGGWGLAAHAQTCESANCWMQIDEANDPAYQSASTGHFYGHYTSYYPYYYQNQYPYQNPYQYPQYSDSDQIVGSYWWDGCFYTIRLVNGKERTSHTCD